MLPALLSDVGTKLGVPRFKFNNLLEQLKMLSLLLQLIIKDTSEQPDGEVRRARLGRVPSAGAPVTELECVPLPAYGCVHQFGSCLNSVDLGGGGCFVLMEVS